MRFTSLVIKMNAVSRMTGSGKMPLRLGSIAGCFLLGFSFITSPLSAQQMISGKEISQQVTDYLAAKGMAASPAISANRQLRACETPLEITPLFGSYKTVSVVCTGKTGWKLAIRTQISTAPSLSDENRDERDEAASAARIIMVTSIKKGEVITEADIGVKNVTGYIAKDTFTRPQDVVGRIAKRNISVGQPVRAASLEMSWTIKKGQKVKLITKVGPVMVSSDGIALENAQWGQMARFLNLGSDREVEGRVVSEKKIAIGPKIFRN